MLQEKHKNFCYLFSSPSSEAYESEQLLQAFCKFQQILIH